MTNSIKAFRMFTLMTAITACFFLVASGALDAAPLEGNVDQQEQSNQGDQKVYRQTGTAASLESSLTHPDRLASVMNQFRIGASFNETDRAKFRCRAQWFRLPTWLAGKWHCEEPTDEIKTENLEKNTMRVELAARRDDEGTILMGHQIDLTRQIWHFICVPFTALYLYDSKDPVVLIPTEVSIQQFPNSTPWSTVLNERFIALELKAKPSVITSETKDSAGNQSEVVDENEYQIASATQHDIVIVYSYTSKISITSHVSEEVYDEKGMPLSTKRTTHNYKKESEFTASNKLDEVDLLKSITEFLQGNGMADRVPEAKKTQ